MLTFEIANEIANWGGSGTNFARIWDARIAGFGQISRRIKMMTEEFSLFRLPVNLDFVAYALRDERPDTVSFLDITTGGVLTLRVDPGAGRLGEGLDGRICHYLNDHPEQFVTLELLDDGGKEKFIADFAEGVDGLDLRERLRDSANRDNGFSLVEEVLSPYPELRERWKECLDRFLLAEALELVRENFIEPQVLPAAGDLRPFRVSEGIERHEESLVN